MAVGYLQPWSFLGMKKKSFLENLPDLWPVAKNKSIVILNTYMYIFHQFIGRGAAIKVENILKGSLFSIPSPSPSVKIQIMAGKFA